MSLPLSLSLSSLRARVAELSELRSDLRNAQHTVESQSAVRQRVASRGHTDDSRSAGGAVLGDAQIQEFEHMRQADELLRAENGEPQRPRSARLTQNAPPN
eukprot:COSAG01_NODE_1798_length_9184_cov_6.067860_11_plen_101_part_00